MADPSIHVVVLNWNGLADTLECLASLRCLLGATPRTHVIDNGSRGDEAHIIAKSYPEVNVMALPENLGFCEGNNLGITRALDEGADFVVLLNNDTLVEATLLTRLLQAWERLDSVGAVSPVICEQRRPQRVWFSRATWEPARAQFRLCEEGETYGDVSQLPPYESEFACGCCMMVSADVIRRVGVLDGRYFAFYDEADWCCRMKRAGFRSYVIPSACIQHKISRSTPGLVATYLLTRNRPIWMRENLPMTVSVRSLPYLAREVMWHVARACGLKLNSAVAYDRRHSRAVLAGWRDYLLGRRGKWSESAAHVIFDEAR